MTTPNIAAPAEAQHWKFRLAISDHEALQVSDMLKKSAPKASSTVTHIALEKLVGLVASDPEPAFWLYTFLVSQLPAEK